MLQDLQFFWLMCTLLNSPNLQSKCYFLHPIDFNEFAYIVNDFSLETNIITIGKEGQVHKTTSCYRIGDSFLSNELI